MYDADLVVSPTHVTRYTVICDPPSEAGTTSTIACPRVAGDGVTAVMEGAAGSVGIDTGADGADAALAPEMFRAIAEHV